MYNLKIAVMSAIFGTALTVSPMSFANTQAPSEANAQTTKTAENIDTAIRQTLMTAGLNAPVTRIIPAPFANLYEVSIAGEDMSLYIDQAVSYVIQGQISVNPSPITPIHTPNGVSGTPLSPAHKQALLANMSELRAVNADTPFYYTAIDGVLWGIADGLPFLLSRDGKYLLDGEISRIVNGQFVGLDTDFERQKNRHVFTALDDAQLITYQAKNEKAILYIATDVNCPYCRLLHKEYPKLVAQGITIKTIGYPVYDESPEPMRQLWCEPDSAKRRALLDIAMKGIMPKAICRNDDNHLIANQRIASGLAVVATPAIYRADGVLFEGDFRGDELTEFLGVK